MSCSAGGEMSYKLYPAGGEGWTKPGVTQAERAGCPSEREDERGRSAERREAALGPPERPGEATPSISRRDTVAARKSPRAAR